MDDYTILNQEQPDMADKKAEFAARYEQAKCACRTTFDRLKNDLIQTHGNPYLRATSIVRYEVLNTPTDEEPVDVFEFRRSNGCYLRTLALAAGVVATVKILSWRAKINKAKKRKK